MDRLRSRRRRALATLVPLLWLLAQGVQAGAGGAALERQAGQLFEQMKAQIPRSRDVRAQQLVECVALHLVPRLEPGFARLAWEVVLFEHGSVNAFALPGGRVGVFTGMLRVARDQDMLAAVLGHEMAHVTARHPEKRASRRTLTGLATGLASVFLGGSTVGQRALADVLSIGAELGLNRPYDRDQELEADIRGLRYMAAAGFDPRASIALWKQMGRVGAGAPPEFLSTHPASERRLDALIGELAGALRTFNDARGQGRIPDCR